MRGRGSVGGGAVEQGLEALVNICKQCQMWQSGGCAHCWARWGGFGVGICIFWG